MKIILIVLLSISFLFPGETKVFICDSPTAVAYHKFLNCRGLQRCKHTILEVTLKNAEGRRLRECQICY